MAEEPLALSTVAARSEDESDYETICATVMGSARGRWFLEEYARRNRQSDTALVLAAINRLQDLIQIERAGQGSLAFRTVLLEMARTISEARGQTGDLVPPEDPTLHSNEPSSSRAEILASAERIHDVAWTMRERGMDPATCQEIETLASSILTLPPPLPPAHAGEGKAGGTQPDDATVNKLRDVLQYLEQRIQTMLDACPTAPTPATEASAQTATDDQAGPAEADVVSASETPAEYALEHDPEKWEPVFGKGSCSNKGLERDNDSKKNHPALADQPIPDLAEAAPATAGGAVESVPLGDIRSVVHDSRAEADFGGAGVLASLEENAEHAVTRSVAELELEPLLPKAAPEETLLPLTLDVPPLVVQPMSRSGESVETSELSFSHELAQSSETTNTCAEDEEKTAADLGSGRSEEPGPALHQVSSDVADLDLPSEDMSFNTAAAQKEVAVNLPPAHGEDENAPANTSSLSSEEETRPNELVSSAVFAGALDDNAAQTWDVSLERSRTEPGSIETEPPTPFVSERSDPSNLVRADEEKTVDAAEEVIDIGPAVPAPETEMDPHELPRAETVELAKEAEERDDALQSGDDTEVGPQFFAQQIEALTLELESASQAADLPAPPAPEGYVVMRSEENELVDMVAAPIASTETEAQCVSDATLPSQAVSQDVPAQAALAVWVESTVPGREESLESSEALELVAEAPLESSPSPGIETSPGINTGSIAPQGEAGCNVSAMDEPVVETAATSISEDEVPVLLPDENAPAPAEALSFEEVVQTCDETLVQNLKESSDLEPTEHEARAMVTDTAPAPDVARARDLSAQSTVTPADEAPLRTNDEAQHEATSGGGTESPFLVSPQTVDVQAAAPIASSEHEKIAAEAVDVPTSPHVASTVVAHDDVLSGAWEEAVSNPEAESAHQARLARQQPPEVKPTEALSGSEGATALPLVKPEVVDVVETSADPSFDPIQEIEQELFAPAPMESTKLPVHEPARTRPIDELLPQPTLTEISPARSMVAAAPMETLPPSPSAAAPVLQRPSVVPARPVVRSMPRPVPADPLAALRAMTDEERIALFS